MHLRQQGSLREHNEATPQSRTPALQLAGPGKLIDEVLVDMQPGNCVISLQATHSGYIPAFKRHVWYSCPTLAHVEHITDKWFQYNDDPAESNIPHHCPPHMMSSCATSSLLFLTPPSVTLEGEKFLKSKQQNFTDMRVRGNRLVVYNQIIQPPKGITAEDTQLARLAFKLGDTDENRWVDSLGC